VRPVYQEIDSALPSETQSCKTCAGPVTSRQRRAAAACRCDFVDDCAPSAIGFHRLAMVESNFTSAAIVQGIDAAAIVKHVAIARRLADDNDVTGETRHKLRPWQFRRKP